MTGPSGTVRIDERGRLVLPVGLRRRLGLRPGDEVRISEQADGVLRVESRRAAARALIGSAGRAERSAINELRAERHRQAGAEDHDAQRGSR
ncbi:MAG: AbrB/MazE/SpoVT family DNA-binding domain-containing protein [Solirubrobacteraceae bacterium]